MLNMDKSIKFSIDVINNCMDTQSKWNPTLEDILCSLLIAITIFNQNYVQLKLSESKPQIYLPHQGGN